MRHSSRATRTKWRSIAIASLLMAISVYGLVSATVSSGYFPEFNSLLRVNYTHSPTATYSGYLAKAFFGTYQYLTAVPACQTGFIPCLSDDETVFYLVTEQGTLRLVFYCGLDYCSSPNQIPFAAGAQLQVKGTLLVPSAWPGSRFLPTLNFIGDLYVFSYGPA